METRGRPDVFKRDYPSSSEMIRKIYSPRSMGNQYKTERSAANNYYVLNGARILKEAASEIEHLNLLFDLEKNDIYCKGVLEQLGRMNQDGYSHADIITIGKEAAQARYEGRKVKEIEKYIRHGRTSGEW